MPAVHQVVDVDVVRGQTPVAEPAFRQQRQKSVEITRRGTFTDLNQHPQGGLRQGLVDRGAFVIGSYARGHIGDELLPGQSRGVSIHGHSSAQCQGDLP